LIEINSKEVGCPRTRPFFYKRTVYEKYGLLNLDFPLAADYELMLRFLYRQGVGTTYIPKVLVNPVRKAPLALLDVKYLSRG
jgi:hypothetical protein